MNNYKKGVLLIILSSLFFTLNSAFVRVLDDYSSYEKVFIRNTLSLLIIAPALIKNKTSIKVPDTKVKWMILRCACGVLGMITSYYVVSNAVYYSESAILSKLNPFFIIIFAGILLKEKITMHNVLAIFIAFAGVLVTYQPNLGSSLQIYAIGIASSVFAGLAYTSVRSLAKVVDSRVIVFYFGLSTAVVTGIIMIVTEGFIVPRGIDILYFVFVGLFATAGQLVMTSAYKYAEASKIGVFNFISIIFALFIDVLFFNTIPTTYTIIGGLVVIGAGVYNYYFTLKKINTESV